MTNNFFQKHVIFHIENGDKEIAIGRVFIDGRFVVYLDFRDGVAYVGVGDVIVSIALDAKKLIHK